MRDRARRVRDRVVEQVVEDLVEVGGVALRRARRRPARDRVRLEPSRLARPSAERPRDGVAEVDVRRLALLDLARHHRGAGRRSRTGDRPPGPPPRAGGGRSSSVASAIARLEAELHAGERRSELVRGVRDELPLGLHRPLEAVGHLVERLPELLDLARRRRTSSARAERSPSPRRFAAAASRVSGRDSDPASPNASSEPGQRAPASPIAISPSVVVADAVVDLLRRSCVIRTAPTMPPPSSMIGTAVAMMSVVRDRRCAGSRELGVPLERRADLGSAGRVVVASPRLAEPSESATQDPLGVHHDHPSARPAAGAPASRSASSASLGSSMSMLGATCAAIACATAERVAS